MIGSLKRKFVISTSIIFLVFTLILITAINAFNFYTTTKYVDGIIDIINSNNGGKPKDIKNDQGGFMRPISRRSLTNTKYFSVIIGKNGEISDVNISSDNVTREDAVAYAESVLQKNKTSGYIEDYRYKVSSVNKEKDFPPDMENIDKGEMGPIGGETVLTFFDWYEQKNSLVSGIVLSYVIGGVCMAVVVLLLIVFSKKAVDPISESIGAQKEFITNVSHEIKTPLTVISGDVDILKMSGVDNEWLDHIKEQVQKSKYLVDDLVLLSKMNEENITLSFEKFDVSAYVDESVATFYSVAETRDLAISSDIKKGIFVNANRRALGELVSILIENALKYCDAGGKISVDLSRSGKTLVLTVANDYKEEMNQEYLEKMFDRYFRTRKAQSNADGSGIGLSIAKAIVVAHHGSISAAQADGKMVITALMNVLDKAPND